MEALPLKRKIAKFNKKIRKGHEDMKKAITLLLVLCMSMTFFVMADEDEGLPAVQFPDVVKTEYEQAVTELSKLNIISGYEDGTFRPLENITRAEFTAVITRLLALDKEVEAASSDQNFSDMEVGYWATPYINAAFDKKIISGYGDGQFGPRPGDL